MNPRRTSKDDTRPSHNLGLRTLGGNVGRTMVATLGAALFGLGLSILLARMLGPEANGLYALALLLPMMLANFLNLGINSASVYYIGRGDVSVRRALKMNLALWLPLSVAGFVTAAVVITQFSDSWFPGIPTSLMWLAMPVFPVSLLQMFMLGVLHARQDFRRYNAVHLLQPFVTLALAVCTLLLTDWGVSGVVGAFLLGQILGLAVTTLYLVPHWRAERATDTDDQHETWNTYARKCISYGFKAHLSTIAAFVNYRMDLFFVNLYLTPALAGVYSISIQIAEKLWIVSKVASTVLLPRLVELHSEEEKRLVLTPLVFRFVMMLTLLGSLAMAIVAAPIINALWGAEFRDSTRVLLLLLPGIVLGSGSRILANDLSARGKPEINFYISVAVLVGNVILNIMLIPRLGIIGGAISTTIAYTINTALKTAVYTRMTRTSWTNLYTPTGEDLALVRQAFRIWVLREDK